MVLESLLSNRLPLPIHGDQRLMSLYVPKPHQVLRLTHPHIFCQGPYGRNRFFGCSHPSTTRFLAVSVKGSLPFSCQVTRPISLACTRVFAPSQTQSVWQRTRKDRIIGCKYQRGPAGVERGWIYAHSVAGDCCHTCLYSFYGRLVILKAEYWHPHRNHGPSILFWASTLLMST